MYLNQNLASQGSGDVDGVVGAALQVGDHVAEQNATPGVAGGVQESLDVILGQALPGIVHLVFQGFRSSTTRLSSGVLAG